MGLELKDWILVFNLVLMAWTIRNLYVTIRLQRKTEDLYKEGIQTLLGEKNYDLEEGLD